MLQNFVQNTRPDPSSKPNTVKPVIKIASKGAYNYLYGRVRLLNVILQCNKFFGCQEIQV